MEQTSTWPETGPFWSRACPYFPAGYYYVPYGLSDDTVLNDLRAIKAGGFNVVHTDARDETPEEKLFLTRYQNVAQTYAAPGNPSMYVMLGGVLREYGVTCAHASSPFASAASATDPEVALRKYQRHPSFLSYTLSDDAFTPDPTSRCTGADLRTRATYLNGFIDAGVAPSPDPTLPDKKKLLNVTGAAVFRPYAARAENQAAFQGVWDFYRSVFREAPIIGIQAHSGLNGGSSAMPYYSVLQATEVAEAGEDPAMSAAPRAGLGYRSVWAELQSTGEGSGITLEQMAVEPWAAIAAGAKGLMWYAYRDQTFTTPPAAFEVTRKVVADLKRKAADGTELSNILLNGARRLAVGGAEDVFGTSWSLPNGKKYLLVVNTRGSRVTANESILQFFVSGTTLTQLALGSAPAAGSDYGLAPWTDPRGVVLKGTLPARSATMYELR